MNAIKEIRDDLRDILNNRNNLVSRRYVRPIVLILATLNIVSLMLYSYDHSKVVSHVVTDISYYSGILFTIEYLLRLWVAGRGARLKSREWNRLKYMFSFFGLVDFIAILPLCIPLFLAEQHIAVEIISFTKVFLILKVIRYSESFRLLQKVLQSARQELIMVLSITLVIVTFSSMLMYYVERNAQPEVFSTIGQGFWWAVITFSTIGYGDIYPITSMGKMLGGVIAIVSIGKLAMPTAIISSALTAKIQSDKDRKLARNSDSTDRPKCPHCGESISKTPRGKHHKE